VEEGALTAEESVQGALKSILLLAGSSTSALSPHQDGAEQLCSDTCTLMTQSTSGTLNSSHNLQ